MSSKSTILKACEADVVIVLTLAGQGPSQTKILLASAIRDKRRMSSVKQSRNLVFWSRNGEVWAYAIKEPSPRLEGAFCFYRQWWGVIKLVQACIVTLHCTRPFLSSFLHTVLLVHTWHLNLCTQPFLFAVGSSFEF